MSGERRPLQLDCVRRVRRWAPAAADLQSWAGAALGRRGAGAELGVCIVGAAESRRLNRRYRGRDTPTNVLSFPAARLPRSSLVGARPRPLGDLVVCAAVVRDEAHAQGKSLRAHWAHLIVHGALHLIGYDHEHTAAEAARMERREVAVLRRLGFANPYRSAV